jgi:mono/diheme cytochrome c family protein
MRHRFLSAGIWAFVLLGVAGCGRTQPSPAGANGSGSDGPSDTGQVFPQRLTGNTASGRDVYRFETFGNERFWTDAMRLPQGMEAAKFTPKQALEAGLQVDVDAVPAALRATLERELKSDLSPAAAPTLNDPAATVALVNANAVVGVVPKDSNKDGTLDIKNGDKVGITCTICHTITDKSVFDMPNGGSIGRRVDGPAALTLDMGKLLAMAANSRAYYPNLQQTFLGISIGRARAGLGPKSTEAEVDAYLTNREFYPVGTFDETHDGNGNSVKNVPLFRQDLAAPYGSAGEHALLENIGNGSYTTNLDLTTLATPDGRAFLEMKAGPAGRQLSDEYASILRDTGVTGFPYVVALRTGKVGAAESPVGLRVDEQKLLDMNAYLASLPAPRGAHADADAASRGREMFRGSCTACHNADQSNPVPATLVELKTLWPGYVPIPAGVRGDGKLSTILNAPGTFDDKMIVVDASDRGEKRGNAMPLLLDLARTNLFLHDASVGSLDALLDPERGKNAPHPFYIAGLEDRRAMIEFLRGLETPPVQAGK